MDRARGKFHRSGSNGSNGSGGRHSGSNSPHFSGGRGGNGGNGNGGESSKRRRSTESVESQGGKRQRAGPSHGTENRRKGPRFDLDFTRPGEIKTGHGTDAARNQAIIQLKANYFRLSNRPQFTVYQYHVDIEPEVDSTRIKRGIFYECTKNIRIKMVFTGTSLYTTEKLPEDVTVINGSRKQRNNPDETSPVTIKIKLIKEVTSFQEVEVFQVFNTIMRQALQGLKLQLVGRNYFDAVASVPIHNLRVEVWPGYLTSIRQHDDNVLMCCETTSKVMRNETLYQIFKTCVDNHGNFREAFSKSVLGLTVLTDYNNKTYRVDDVDFEQTPESTFETKNGPKSYMSYYYEVS